MKKNARVFNCARCHVQVVICSHCDRGNIYCGSNCSQLALTTNHRTANQIYQKTLKGRQKHAQRQRRYRQRQKEKQQKVTDGGSHDLPTDDLLFVEPEESQQRVIEPIYCHFCGEAVPVFLRSGFLRYHPDDKSHDSSSWPFGP